VIAATGLSKRFGGKRVFERLNLRLERGGFLLVTGPNGSGKTTLLRVLAGLDAPTGGELLLPERRSIGYLGHEPFVYRELSGRENLKLFARLYRVDEASRVETLLEQFELAEVGSDPVLTYSRGMRQRLGLCRTILHAPELLILDEPFNALDLAGIALLDATLAEFAPAAAIVLATHDPGRVAAAATDTLAFA
jgi:heme ABC exporter ATP-binding subunit CcmA